MILNPIVYQTGGGGDKPVLLVTVTGATPTSVIASKSGTSVSLAYDSTIGKWWAYLPSTGTWTVTASGSIGNTKTTTVSASDVAVYEASLQLARVPDGYTELEYIQSSGTQYIDTGISCATADLSIQVSYMPTSGYTSQYAVFGAAWAFGAYFFMIYRDNWRYHGAENSSVDIPNVSTSAFSNIIATKSEIAVNGSAYSVTAPSSFLDQPLHLFDSGDSEKRGHGKSKTLSLFSGAAKIGEFVPAKRNSDTVVGMYDIVGNSFHVNAGTGSFIGGPVVS